MKTPVQTEISQKQKEYIERVTSQVPFLNFNYKRHQFDITIPDITWEQIKELNKALTILRNEPIRPGICQTYLDELQTGYYDKCLEYYCYERLDLGIPHKETCWVRYAEKVFCIGRIAPNTELTDSMRNDILSHLARQKHNGVYQEICKMCRTITQARKCIKANSEGWVMFYGDIPIRSGYLKNRIRDAARRLTRRIFGTVEQDRVLNIVESIRRHGWDPELAYQPSCSLIGYSHSTKRFLMLTGRHRIAALRYLYSKGEVPGSIVLDYPVITYRWSDFLHGCKHPDISHCLNCTYSVSSAPLQLE